MTTEDAIGKAEFGPVDEMIIVTPPQPDTWLFMGPGTFIRWSYYGYPNAWRRFWYRSLLDWRFERITDEKRQ